ncbi:MAG: beta-ketoacyl-[acyl-carrier-protein] synthase family protein [Planctomycetia bacterium]|nr:MAG: beta-ketoacyl-[acyl-carrier-protein] synthase family protein [Planctomycetia bacterium]
MSDRRVVITGVGPVAPLGVGVAEFWSALLEGRNAVRRISAFDPGRFDSHVGSQVEGVAAKDFVPKGYRKAEKIMARDIVLAVVAAHHAVSDAGLRTKCLIERGDATGEPNLDSTRFGANIGSGLICADLAELAEALHNSSENGRFSIARWGTEGMNNLTPLWLLKFLPNMLACHVTIVHDCQGPSNTITCGEASSHLAIGEAFRTIARGVADVCICGGAESKINPMALLRQSLGRRLSRRNDDPATACRPFGLERDGTAISEGGGLVILEDLEHARRRGARIYAELVGFGAANDAAPPTQPSTPPADGRGAALALRKALRDAKLDPQALDLVSAFAPGIPAHDASEAAALKAVLGARLAEVPILAIKGGIGNNGAGSGALDFIAMVLSLYNATLPPTVNGRFVDPSLGLRATVGRSVDARVETAASLAYALGGGQNAALLIRRYRD